MTDAVTLEITASTTFRGPLAEQLIQEAARRGRTPVDCLADMMERALSDDGATLRECRELTKARQRIAELRSEAMKRLKRPVIPTVKSLACLSASAQHALEKEARGRDMSADDLVKRLIETIVADNMFAAILDL